MCVGIEEIKNYPPITAEFRTNCTDQTVIIGIASIVDASAFLGQSRDSAVCVNQASSRQISSDIENSLWRGTDWRPVSKGVALRWYIHTYQGQIWVSQRQGYSLAAGARLVFRQWAKSLVYSWDKGFTWVMSRIEPMFEKFRSLMGPIFHSAESDWNRCHFFQKKISWVRVEFIQFENSVFESCARVLLHGHSWPVKRLTDVMWRSGLNSLD